MKYISFLLLMSLCLSCTQTFSQQPDNLQPMYGSVPKSQAYKDIDNRFTEGAIKVHGNTDSAVAFYLDQAWRYFYNKDLNTAMKRFNQAWLLNPEFPDPYFGFAALIEMRGQHEEGARLYKIAKEKDKTQKRAGICYHRIADCKEQSDDIRGTIAAFVKLLEVRPDYAYAYKKLGYFYMQTNEQDKAMAAYNKAITLDPSDAGTYSNRGYLYQTLKDYKHAIEDYTKGIKADPAFINNYVNRGVTYMETGNFAAAKKDFEHGVQADAQSGQLRRLLGVARLNLNEKNDACKDFDLAVTLGDTDAASLIKENCK